MDYEPIESEIVSCGASWISLSASFASSGDADIHAVKKNNIIFVAKIKPLMHLQKATLETLHLKMCLDASKG